MVELAARTFFQDCNASKFVVHSCVLLFTVLLALKADGRIQADFWAVFIPLFLWKAIVIAGAIVGTVAYWKNPPTRNDTTSRTEFQGMVVCFFEHILLLSFEILCCIKKDYPSDMSALLWIYVFAPLVVLCIFCIIVCIWAVRKGRSFELELFFSVNTLQFAFIALKLDEYIRWPYLIVFIPMWILICLSLIGVLYAVVLAVLLLRSIELLPEHRRQHVYTAIGYTFLVVPILIFLVLLTSRVEGESGMPYVMVCTPLYISLLCLIIMACSTRGGNPWWFGIRRDFCSFLLDLFPCLQEYGNVSYRFESNRRRQNRSNRTADQADSAVELAPNGLAVTIVVSRDTKPVCPIVSIECPD